MSLLVDSINFLTAEYGSSTPRGPLVNHMTLHLQPDLSQSYILKSATGLDPGELLSQYYASITIDQDRYLPGERYYDFKPAPRIVSFKIRLNPQWGQGESPQSLRQDLYKMIAYHPGGLISMQFMNGEDTAAWLFGFITNFETDLFAEQPEVTITLKCIDPFFRGFGVEAGAELPADSTAANNFTITFDPSSAPHGFNAEFILTIDQEAFEWNSILGTSAPAQFVIEYSFKANDKLYLRTDAADRQAYVETYASGYADKVYLMDRVRQNSVWPTMFPNLGSVSSANAMGTGSGSGFVISALAWEPTYWGL